MPISSILTSSGEKFRVILAYDKNLLVMMMMMMMMITMTILFVVLIFFSKQISGLFSPSLLGRKKLKASHPNWNEDELFMENFGELYKELKSSSAMQLMESYNQLPSHVTHFCFLVHGYSGFSKVRFIEEQ
jgi:hypothetical protein